MNTHATILPSTMPDLIALLTASASEPVRPTTTPTTTAFSMPQWRRELRELWMPAWRVELAEMLAL